MTERELQSMRKAAEVLLIDRANIERRSSVSDGQLGQTEVWTITKENVPCRVYELGQYRSNREMPQGGQVMSEGEHTVRFPFGTDIHEADRIVVTTLQQTRTFDVARVIEHSYATNMTVVVTEGR